MLLVPAPVMIVPPGTVQLYVAPGPASGTLATFAWKAHAVAGVVMVTLAAALKLTVVGEVAVQPPTPVMVTV